jgi:hypothetical protein
VAEPERPIGPDDLAVTLGVRKDLGPQHDEAVIAEFLDRVGGAIDKRVDDRLAARRPLPGLPADHRAGGPSPLAYASIGMGIPITAIALSVPSNDVAGVIATAIAWLGIAAVNVAYAGRR